MSQSEMSENPMVKRLLSIVEGIERYDQIVSRNAKRFSIDPSLIYAIIEAGSKFNPKAKSFEGDVGLMQVNPNVFGKVTYKYLYKSERELDYDYLADPEHNIELGVGSLYLLASSYLPKVTNVECRELCMILAYNVGIRGLKRGLSCSLDAKVDVVTDAINALSYNELYTKFMAVFANKELAGYLKNVTAKREKYRRF